MLIYPRNRNLYLPCTKQNLNTGGNQLIISFSIVSGHFLTVTLTFNSLVIEGGNYCTFLKPKKSASQRE